MFPPDARAILQTNPGAQQLLQSAIPARLAYTWHDGHTPGGADVVPLDRRGPAYGRSPERAQDAGAGRPP